MTHDEFLRDMPFYIGRRYKQIDILYSMDDEYIISGPFSNDRTKYTKSTKVSDIRIFILYNVTYNETKEIMTFVDLL